MRYRSRLYRSVSGPRLATRVCVNEQVIHGTSTLGLPKVHSARDRMLDVNPHVKVETFHEQLTSENALRILDGYDVVSLRARIFILLLRRMLL